MEPEKLAAWQGIVARQGGGQRIEWANAYGLTETTVTSAVYRLRPRADAPLRAGAPVPVGRPIDGARAHVLDSRGGLVAAGVPGELCLGGPGLARGYVGRPDLTARAFLPDPFATPEEPGARLFRTGDLARRRPDGELELLGRADFQVKVRGYRIEPGEVEAALAAHPGVAAAVAMAREDRPGDRRLVAYVVPAAGAAPETLTSPELRRHLQGRLPEYMIPSAFVLLAALPQSANGKVDRRALPAPDVTGADRAAGFEPPRGAAERALAAIWAEVLGVERIGRHDTFWDLGGHSLLATRVVSRLRDALGVELPLRALFEAPTLAGLARRIAGLGGSAEREALVPQPRTGALPLSFAQQRLWVLDRFEPGSTLYNMPAAFRLQGRLRTGDLAAALDEIVRRHEILRTVFAEAAGEPVQVVLPFAPGVLARVDLRRLPAVSREAEAARLTAEVRQPFDLARGPLLRAALLVLDGEEHRLLLDMHHIVSDGWSIGVLLGELSALLSSPAPLPELPVQYADFALWQRRRLGGGALDPQLAYWREKLAGVPRLDLPTDRPRPRVQSFRGAVEGMALPAPVVAALERLARRAGATLFMTFLAAFEALLRRHTGQDDFAVGTPISGRDRSESEELIGFFVNTLVLRADLAGDPDFLSLLSRVRETALAAYAHQDVFFERLVEELAPERDLARTPIFQVLFALHDDELPALRLGPGLAVEDVELPHRTAKFDLTLDFARTAGTLAGGAEYATDLFDAATVRRMLERFGVLLAGIAEDPERPLSALPVLTAAEREQMVATWNRTETAYPRESTIPAVFAEVALRTPDAVAVVFGEERLTYAGLDARSKSLAVRLRALGAGPEVAVAVLAERSLDLVVALLGVLRSGAFYVPLDPKYPAERTAFLLADVAARVVVAQESLAAVLPEWPERPGTSVVILEKLAETADAPLPADLDPQNLAFVMYTSGSTGEPKGAGISHRNVLRVARENGFARFAADDVFLQLSPVAFDASTLEIWCPLLNGARLVVMPPSPPSLAELAAAVERHGVTALWLTAGLFHPMVEEQLASLSGVRHLMAGGDVLSPAHVRRALAGLPATVLTNGYGPTENTTFTTCHAMTDPGQVGETVSIGRPIANTRVFVLDGAMAPVPLGTVGNLYAGGDGLARGYLRRPGLTAERFVPDPVSGRAGERLYATGDLARFRPDGTLDFLGRADAQVKVRGFRVEPGEIEAALNRLPVVAASTVVLREDVSGDNRGDKRLVAYVVRREGEGVEARDLRAALEATLPEPLLPSRFVFLAALPLNANGKVDRRALPAPEGTLEDAAEIDGAPVTPAEELLAGVFAALLGVDRVGVDAHFFHLGGHSLLATRLVSRVRELFAVEIPLRAVFEAPTVAGLAAAIEALRRQGAGLEAPPIVPYPGPRRGLPLSFAQQRLWFLDRLQPGTAAYNIPLGLRLAGPLALAALAGALAAIVARHEVLRTAFAVEEGEPVQVVRDDALVLPLVDLTSLSGAVREAEAARLAAVEADLPFDLERGPVLRAMALRLGHQNHRLLLTLHHIAADGWSVGVLLHELSALYGALLAGRPSPLPPLAVQYADFAVWQRRWLAGEVLAAQLDFWRHTLDGCRQVLELPADRPRPTVQSQRGASERFALPPELAAGLARVARDNGATLYMTLLAAFGALVQRTTGAADFLLASPIANRNRAEIEGLIGFFVNTLVLRNDLTGDPTFAAALGRVRATALAAYAHQDLPFEKLVEELAPERDLSRSPLVQVSLSLQNAVTGTPATAAEPAELAPGLALAFEDVAATTAKLDLSLGFEPTADGLAGGAEYSTDLFDAVTIRRLFGHLGVLLAGVVASPRARLSELPLLTAKERSQLAAWHAETAFDHPRGPAGGLLHEPFEAQAARRPEALALIVGEEEISYGELDARAEALAHRLMALGVGPEVAVGLCLARNADLIVAMFATLKAGGFYVPLDPNYPAERLGFMLADSRCRVILAHRAVLDRLPRQTESAVVVVDELAAIPTEALPRRVSRQLPGNLAYLIYTSGSTGRPKAVAIEHRSATLLAHWARRVYTPAELAGVLGSTSITFDMSVFEIFATLALGGTLILAENALALARLPARDRVTLIDTVPSAIAELLAQGAVPASVLTVNLGGEPVPRALADRVYERPGIARLLNLYGPSEDTTFSTVALIERRSQRAPAIGRPFDRTRAHVVGAGREELPVGVPGELHLGGDGLARGYLGQPALTADRFGPDPFSEEPGARLYRTGDLARRRPDGELEYLGRIDHQVKVRGFRVELGEIESALLAQPGVAAAAVMAREYAAGDLRLVAYLVQPEGETALADLRRALQALLPDYMVPAAFVWLPELPLSPNGKVDRRRLPAPDVARTPQITDAFEPPRTELERAVAGIWSAVLGVERIGRHDNFWHLGGHSLLATKVLARLHAELGIELPLQAIFNSPSLAELTVALGHAAWPADELVPVPREDGVALPVSFGQERLWFLDRFSPGSAVYNLPTFYRLRGDLDVPRLAAALAALVARHEVLRTVFRAVDGEPQQVVRPPAEDAAIGLPLVDLGALPAASRDAEAAHLARQESARPFDLERGPLLRAALLRLAGAEHLLLLDAHHIVSDGWSVEVMLRELAAFYTGAGASLPELPVQYADFAFWQRRWLDAEALEEKLAYWRRRLAGRPAQLDLPADRPRPAVQSFRGGVESLRLPDELALALERTGHDGRATLFMTLLAAFQALLHRWSGQEDVVVGTPTANRNRPEIQELIGFFVNTLVLRTDLAGEPAFGELLARVRETALGAYAHQDLPFDRLVTELAPERDPARTPLFQVMFALHHLNHGEASEGERSFVPGVGMAAFEVGEVSSKFDLSLHLTRAGSELHASAEYSTALFDADTVRRMLGHLAALLAGIAADPRSRISELPLLSEAERSQLVAGWNETRADFPRTTPVHRLFAARAAAAPEAPALLWDGGHLTYGELDARSSRLARRLRALGVGAGTLVALLLERSPELVIAALAVLEAGGGYVPLDPKDPAERLSFVLDDTRAPVVVGRAGDESVARLARAASHAPRLLLLEDPEISGEDASDPWVEWDDETDAESTAYVIYTSGSTGRPKGVEVPHRAIGRLVIGTDYVHLGPGDRVAHLSNPAFDAAVFEVWGALLNGAALVLVPREVALAPMRLAALLRDREVTTMFLTTALFNLMVREAPGAFATLRDVLFGGEAVDPAIVRACLAAGPPARLLHVYGPTESTTFSTWHRVTAVDEGDTVPIGQPLANTTVHVVDRRLRPVPVGVPGELTIGGDGLAHGYLHRPELTAERFVPDPFASEGAGSRLYRTGDLVRRRPGGDIEFLGRLDTQVKVRGFRIELGEIEGALAAHPAVRAAVVLAREDAPGDRRLVAYVVGNEMEEKLDVAALRAFLERRLPAYMVPSAFVELAALPLNPNGKVDRRALPAPEAPGSGEEYVAPRTDLEREVAAVWAEVLGVERIGLNDNFWHLGGHSLLATKVLSRLHAALGVDLPVATIFNAPTLAAFAGELGRAVLAEPGEGDLDDLLAEIDALVGARQEEG